MSLNWQWTDKMGEVTYTDSDRVDTLYQGNALAIAIADLPDDCYTLAWFASDKEHLRNMLGLTKGYDECFSHFGIKSLRLNTRYKSVPQIVADIAKAKLPITIELYYDEN